MESGGNGYRRNRSRSRSQTPEQETQIMLLITEAYVSHFTNTEVLNHIKEDSGIDRYCLYETGMNSNERFLAILSPDLNKCMKAYKLVINEFMTIPEFSINSEGMIIMIPENSVASLVGRNGSTIKKFQEQSGTKITVLDKIASSSDKAVKIVGRSDSVEEATLKIQTLIYRRSRNQSPKRYGSSIKFVVPITVANVLIGKTEQIVRKFKNDYNVDIRESKNERRPVREDEELIVNFI